MTREISNQPSMYELGDSGSGAARGRRGTRGSGKMKMQATLREQSLLDSLNNPEKTDISALSTFVVAGHLRAAATQGSMLLDAIGARLSNDPELCIHVIEMFTKAGDVSIQTRYELDQSPQPSSFQIDATGPFLAQPIISTGRASTKIQAKQEAYKSLLGEIISQIKAAST